MLNNKHMLIYLQKDIIIVFLEIKYLSMTRFNS